METYLFIVLGFAAVMLVFLSATPSLSPAKVNPWTGQGLLPPETLPPETLPLTLSQFSGGAGEEGFNLHHPVSADDLNTCFIPGGIFAKPMNEAIETWLRP
jgi:hypothetical protein